MNQFDVILTHEYTDFDALASLLAASLLYPNAIPVLPSHLNRNVRAFLAAYRPQYPFRDRKDLPRGRVRRAILVDARGVNQTKGMDDDTEYLIIDHHTHDKPLPAGWTLISEPVGANVTLLAEMLMARGQRVTPVQATLLALGIHEDTGSLTYGATTDRDAHALAWLMGQGADVQVIGRWVHHPLSAAQRTLLELLKTQTEFLHIADYHVAIATARVIEFDDEFSALAARLRDDLDVDGLFLLIEQAENIQLIARSTTDDIDVALIARKVGGGGHARAAAAIIHNRTSPAIRDRIVELASEMIAAKCRARVTVAQIMSVGPPRMIAPDMSIEDALTLMRRYGHEGFPVVEYDNEHTRLLGILTRRQADRADDHRLSAEPVQRFMRAGQVTVRPNTPIADLRELMRTSDWGQVPVVDDAGRFIGIVTRTDLIGLDNAGTATSGFTPATVAYKLREALTPVQRGLLQLLGSVATTLDYALYVVGGFVRDLLLEQPALGAACDLDIVIEGDAIVFARQIRRQFGGRIVPHDRFGTAKWILDDPQHPIDADVLMAALDNSKLESSQLDSGPSRTSLAEAALPSHLDFVTARTEFYTAPTALPTVESSSIKFDLHRRDFTINTLAICLTLDRWGTLLDFYGGLDDLKRGIVRVLHSLSFVDDPTRMLRAARYEQRFGFRIEARTVELLHNALPHLTRVTAARIRHELDRTLQEDAPEKTLQRLDELGILAQLHPSLCVSAWAAEQFPRLRDARNLASNIDSSSIKRLWADTLRAEAVERLYWALLVYPLPSTIDGALATRLGLRQETQRLVADLRLLQDNLNTLRTKAVQPSVVVALLDWVTPTALAILRVICDSDQAGVTLDHYQSTWRHIVAELNGDALRALGLSPGPQFGQILRQLRTARLDGKVTSRAAEEALAIAIANA